MSTIRVAPIVEGHAEEASAIRILLERTWLEIVGGDYIDILRPIRIPKSRLSQARELPNVLDLAAFNLKATTLDMRQFILILFDADEDCPIELVSPLRQTAREQRADMDVAIEVANVEFETWFVAGAESLGEFFDLSRAAHSLDPEAARQGKATVNKMMGGIYRETRHQPRLTRALDLQLCRSRSRSFDKFCRELERRKNG